jgi:hypothetical protein
VAQGDQFAGFFGALNARDAGDTQHITLLGVAALDQRQGGRFHADAAFSHRHAVGAGFGGHVHHVGLPLGVEMGEGAGGLVGHGGLCGGFTETLSGWRHHTVMSLFPKTFRRAPIAAVSRAALSAGVLSVLALLPVAPLGAQANRGADVATGLPSLGDGTDMSIAAERRLGDGIARDIYRDPDYLDDPVLGDYLQAVWQPLLGAARTRGDVPPELAERLAWELMVSRDKRVNAFALPGGYLGVNLGLLAVTETPEELASVLAHELSHVSQRHIARMISRQDQQAPWILGTMILGMLAARANADVANAAVAGSQAVAAQTQLNFSRDMEREADRVGFGVLTSAGFDGMGFVTMFDKLQQAARHNDDGSFPYLRSHPLSSERIADMRARLPIGGGPRVGPLNDSPLALPHP